MSAKSTSPEAAQKKVWAAEARALNRNRRQCASKLTKETKRLDREIDKLMKQRVLIAKLADQEARVIDRRLGILNGRIGL